MVTPFEFFMGFSRYYNSLRITFEESIETNTGRVISYVDTLGRMLGYRIFAELSFHKLFEATNRVCPPQLKNKKPDMCWGYSSGDEGLRMEYELVLESEQQMDDDKIVEDIEKLLVFPAKLRILYCAHKNPERVIELVKEVAQKRKEFTGELLLIIDPWVSRKTFSAGQLKGVLMNSNLEITHSGNADITRFKDGDSNIRLFKNVRWEDKTA